MSSDPPILLGLNIDHAATVRQARYREYARDCGEMVEPDPVALAVIAERAGADGITVHLREDRRHIQESDVRRLRECLQVPLNLEMACTPEMMAFARELQPDKVCLVPESREEVTTEGGLDVHTHRERVEPIVQELSAQGIEVSLFIDSEEAQLTTAKALGAPVVELHTGSLANAWFVPSAKKEELEKLRQGAAVAHELGLIVNAGHGINYTNIVEIRQVPWLHELNIGHSIISRALFTGISEAVQRMKALIRGEA